MLPYYLRGIFTRNRTLFSLLARLHAHPFSVRFGRHLQQKYKSKYVYIRMLGRRALVVMDVEGIRHILDNSPSIYAENQLKRTGFGHFQPHSLTISRGDAWRERRSFNEFVLDSNHRLHEQAGPILQVVQSEIASTKPENWEEFDALFRVIMLRTVLGGSGDDPEHLADSLKKRMREANRLVLLRKTGPFARFQSVIYRHVRAPAGGLVSRCPHARTTLVTRPENQVPHWMFAMHETLAVNTAQALALIVSHPEQEERVRHEMSQADLTTPEGIDGLEYLEACVQEAMRLWPSVPLIVRETTRRDTLGGAVVPANTQVLILNNYQHRDTALHPDADRFSPDIWKSVTADYRFNHLSNGRQVCAGKNLALFIAKAVLATLLDGQRYRLDRPTLDRRKPLPYAYDYFKVRFSRLSDRPATT
jgi:cytochrome P450